jgi:O-antigen biosynthesis protein
VAASRSRQRFRPVRLLEVEISEPIPSVPRVDPATGRSYQRALTLGRLHEYPLGTVEIAIEDSAVSAQEHARQIWTSLGTRINNHLIQDGLPTVSELTSAGIPLRTTPNCRRERHAVLGRAPFVSVVVATRNRSHLLGECLHSLLNLEYPNYEILVVDNAPTSDETFQLVTRLSLGRPRLRYLREERAGTSWARNQGVLESTAGIVAFTDDDVIVDKHWLTEITKEFIASPDVGCVTGLVLPAQIETRVQAWFEERGGFSKGFERTVFTRLSRTSENRPYPFVASIFGSGNNMACRVSVLSEFAGFDPALGPGTDALGGEDLAVFYQVIKGGYQLVYTPAAIVFHRHRVDYDAFRKQVRCFGLGLTAYMTKCFVDDPRSVLDFLSQLPAYAANLTRRTATSNGRERSDQPLELTFVELTGMIVGPIAYLRGRRKTRELRRTLAAQFAPRIRPDRRRRPSSQRDSSGAEGATSYE